MKLISKIVTVKYNDFAIELDCGDKLVDLTGLWEMAGSPENNKPNDWRDTNNGSEFIFALEKNLKVSLDKILKTEKKGRKTNIWGHWQIALAYSKYLDPQLHIQVNEWVRQYLSEEKNPELGVNRAVENWKRKGHSDKWIDNRLTSIQVRHKFTDTLRQHGISQGFEYAHCTDAINKNVLGGTAKQIKEEKGLKKNALLRDNLSIVQIAALRLAEALADEDIETNQVDGYKPCLQSCDKAGQRVKKALE